MFYKIQEFDISMNKFFLSLSIFLAFTIFSVTAETKLLNNNQKIASKPNIICWGDSLTAGAGGKGTTYPNELQKLLDNNGYSFKVFNSGVGGENSATVASRAGGIPFMVNIIGNIIPPNQTPIKISFLNSKNMRVAPLYQGSGLPYHDFIGKLGEIEGKINLIQPDGKSIVPKHNDYYTFTRLSNGNQINSFQPQKFTINFSQNNKNDIYIIWIGQNDGKNYQNTILNTIAIINHMASLNKKFIVINKPSGDSSQNIEDNIWEKKFHNNFIPIRQYMVKYGLEDARIKPSLQDQIDISKGIVPSSLRSDQVHFNDKGYRIVANVVFHKMEELGWIK